RNENNGFRYEVILRSGRKSHHRCSVWNGNLFFFPMVGDRDCPTIDVFDSIGNGSIRHATVWLGIPAVAPLTCALERWREDENLERTVATIFLRQRSNPDEVAGLDICHFCLR